MPKNNLEAAPIGGQLFAHGISGRDCIAFCLLLDTYDTRLLAQALTHEKDPGGEERRQAANLRQLLPQYQREV